MSRLWNRKRHEFKRKNLLKLYRRKIEHRFLEIIYGRDPIKILNWDHYWDIPKLLKK